MYLMMGKMPIRSKSSTSRLAQILQQKCGGNVTVIPSTPFKVIVTSSTFNNKPKEDQVNFVYKNLPAEWKNKVFIETHSQGRDNDSEVHPVYLKGSSLITREVVAVTPQNFLDNGVFHLRNGHGSISSECSWLCGSVALKNFAKDYRVDPQNLKAEFFLVDFIARQFKKEIRASWMILDASHKNAYEDYFTKEDVLDSLEEAERFCNYLHEFHSQHRFDFHKYVPDWMYESKKTEKGIETRPIDSWFKFL